MGVTRAFSLTSSTLTKGIIETAVHRGFHSRWTVRRSRRSEAIGTSSDDIQMQLPVVTRVRLQQLQRVRRCVMHRAMPRFKERLTEWAADRLRRYQSRD